jgi:DNA invertase Pin-like site-specific DNA recombinase
MKRIRKIVAYYRLSQPKKGMTKEETICHAYGLKTQRRIVARFARRCNATIIAEFQEIGSGRKSVAERAELARAIWTARQHGATVVVARQDRLARSVYVISGLLESHVDFVTVDRPSQSRHETLLRAMMDEEEAARTSDRTKSGLKMARERGKKFGFANPENARKAGHLRGYRQATIAAARVNHERCLESYSFLIDQVQQLKAEGKTLSEIAEELNRQGHITSAGKPFTKMAVHRVLRMFAKQSSLLRPLGRCCQCGRTFDVSWDSKLEHENHDRPLVCLDCARGLPHDAMLRASSVTRKIHEREAEPLPLSVPECG